MLHRKHLGVEKKRLYEWVWMVELGMLDQRALSVQVE